MLTVDLSDTERTLLAQGLRQWGGPATPTVSLARVMGFRDVEDLLSTGARIADALDAGDPVSSAALARALCATEFVFVSDHYGAGPEWETVSGLSDLKTLRTLRALQRKVASVASLDDDDRPPPPETSPVDAEGALAIARNEIETREGEMGMSLTLLADQTEELDIGWVFFWNSTRYLETRDPREMLGGGGPLLVDRENGSLHEVWSGESWQTATNRYRREGKLSPRWST